MGSGDGAPDTHDDQARRRNEMFGRSIDELPYPGQEIGLDRYMAMSVGAAEPPTGLLEADGMDEGYILAVPSAIRGDGMELHHAFGRDGSGTCYYLGLVPFDGGADAMGIGPADIREEICRMRSDWVFSGGRHPLDTDLALEFLTEFCSMFGIPTDDYGELLDSIGSDGMEEAITCGKPPEMWDSETSLLMNDRSAILRYAGA